VIHKLLEARGKAKNKININKINSSLSLSQCISGSLSKSISFPEIFLYSSIRERA